VEALLDSPPEATDAVGFRLSGKSGSAAPGTRAVSTTTVCVPAGGHADLELTTGRSATIAGPPLGPDPGPPREVGLAVSGVQVSSTKRACRSRS
jgi:hypothetical protein